METLITGNLHNTKTWYSEEYLIQQMEQSYMAGMAKGIRIDFHAIEPRNNEMVDGLINEFHKIIKDNYKYNDVIRK